jgi:uncharacterized small protein (DUF1192 family)
MTPREEYLQSEVDRLKTELAAAKKELHHWKSNHDAQVRSKQRGHEIMSDIIAALRDELDELKGTKRKEEETDGRLEQG